MGKKYSKLNVLVAELRLGLIKGSVSSCWCGSGGICAYSAVSELAGDALPRLAATLAAHTAGDEKGTSFRFETERSIPCAPTEEFLNILEAIVQLLPTTEE